MANNFFITGMPKSGKTTLLRSLVSELRGMGLKVGGFISPEQKEHGTREGFFVEDLETGKRETMACVGCGGPKISKYGVDVKGFESIALPVLRNFKKYDVLVIDEIGRMELKSRKFEDALDAVLEARVPLIATLHRDFFGEYRIFGNVYTLTDVNREEVRMSILEDVKNLLVPRKKGMKKEKSKIKKPAPKTKKPKAEKVKSKPKKPETASTKKPEQKTKEPAEEKTGETPVKGEKPPEETEKKKPGLLDSLKKLFRI